MKGYIIFLHVENHVQFHLPLCVSKSNNVKIYLLYRNFSSRTSRAIIRWTACYSSRWSGL